MNRSLACEQSLASQVPLTDTVRCQSESPGYFLFDNFSRNLVPPAFVCLSGSGECLGYFQQENTRSDSPEADDYVCAGQGVGMEKMGKDDQLNRPVKKCSCLEL